MDWMIHIHMGEVHHIIKSLQIHITRIQTPSLDNIYLARIQNSIEQAWHYHSKLQSLI